ncbi:MFS transporter [Kutzneria sp. 744]|uniref:MFS transporter n=1 Tax=Kutzneria sp. (strain 744) TaxID=345341 RepID=UPI0003EECF25|nr:MFS transporter [Kutzneria sp. 744]EWM17177.1 major facilitator superfamily transporter permease [Kutzneria sp. 744]
MKPWLRAASAVLAVGWGANQFAPLLIVYRDLDHLSSSLVAAVFGAYVIGLIRALLVGPPLSARLGRRGVMRPVLVLSALASVILIFGADDLWLLGLGRLVAGVASGAAFGPGSAWIKELSPSGGARRSAGALSAGFGGGPLVAGILAQWLPMPAVVPYLAHLVVVAVAAALCWHAPETSPVSGRRVRLRNALRHPEFLRRVVPSAPLVFGAATTSFAVLPTILPVPGVPIASSGAIAGLTLGSGLLVQPLARRLEARRAGSVLTFGLASAVLGFLLAALSVGLDQVILLVPTAIVLGCGYGMLLVGGLSRVEALASAEELAGVTAVFYCLAYVGFAAPYLFTAVNAIAPAALVFVAAAFVVALLVPVTVK